jgi:hypothetical protein
LKPDFEEARRRWQAFWNHEIIDRPCIVIRAPKDGAKKVPAPVYMEGRDGNLDAPIARLLEWAENIYWGGEAVPCYSPSFGPDQFAAFLGGELMWSKDSASTSWAVPFVRDWEKALPLRLDPQNKWWQRMLAFVRKLAAATEGKMIISHLDLHSNMDGLSAMRGPQRLLMDLMDMPETIDRAMQSVRTLYQPIFDGVFEAGDMGRRGATGWIPHYHAGKVNTIQCDFICMISPAMFRRYVLPALEEETQHLEHSIYHYDGPGALVHLDDMLSLKRLDGIQWVPGAGNKPLLEWMDLLKRIQAAGKSLDVYCSPAEVKIAHKALRPELLFYNCWAKTEQEARETIEWLKKNT